MIELNARGQASTFDIFISITVFVLLLGTSFVIWNDNFDSIRKESRFDNARFAAVNVLNNFVSTPGVPTNWENLVSVEMYGLAKKRNILSNEKVLAFNAADYNSIKEKMNIEGFEFTFTLIQDGNSIIDKGFSLADPEFVIGIERVVEYDDRPAKVFFRLYQP